MGFRTPITQRLKICNVINTDVGNKESLKKVISKNNKIPT